MKKAACTRGKTVEPVLVPLQLEPEKEDKSKNEVQSESSSESIRDIKGRKLKDTAQEYLRGAFRWRIRHTPKHLAARTEFFKTPEFEPAHHCEQHRRTCAHTGAHFKYDYMVMRLAALARSIENVKPNYNAVLHLTLDILNEEHDSKLDSYNDVDPRLKMLWQINQQKIKKFLIDPKKYKVRRQDILYEKERKPILNSRDVQNIMKNERRLEKIEKEVLIKRKIRQTFKMIKDRYLEQKQQQQRQECLRKNEVQQSQISQKLSQLMKESSVKSSLTSGDTKLSSKNLMQMNIIPSDYVPNQEMEEKIKQKYSVFKENLKIRKTIELKKKTPKNEQNEDYEIALKLQFHKRNESEQEEMEQKAQTKIISQQHTGKNFPEEYYLKGYLRKLGLNKTGGFLMQKQVPDQEIFELQKFHDYPRAQNFFSRNIVKYADNRAYTEMTPPISLRQYSSGQNSLNLSQRRSSNRSILPSRFKTQTFKSTQGHHFVNLKANPPTTIRYQSETVSPRMKLPRADLTSRTCMFSQTEVSESNTRRSHVLNRSVMSQKQKQVFSSMDRRPQTTFNLNGPNWTPRPMIIRSQKIKLRTPKYQSSKAPKHNKDLNFTR